MTPFFDVALCPLSSEVLYLIFSNWKTPVLHLSLTSGLFLLPRVNSFWFSMQLLSFLSLPKSIKSPFIFQFFFLFIPKTLCLPLGQSRFELPYTSGPGLLLNPYLFRPHSFYVIDTRYSCFRLPSFSAYVYPWYHSLPAGPVANSAFPRVRATPSMVSTTCSISYFSSRRGNVPSLDNYRYIVYVPP